MNLQKGKYIKVMSLCYNQKELMIHVAVEGEGEVVVGKSKVVCTTGWSVMQNTEREKKTGREGEDQYLFGKF